MRRADSEGSLSLKVASSINTDRSWRVIKERGYHERADKGSGGGSENLVRGESGGN